MPEKRSMSMQTKLAKLPPPPGLLASLMAGFDSVANHIAVILPPVLLDLFLWLGPHLRLKGFIQPLIDSLPSLAGAFPSNFPDLATIQTVWVDIAEKFNLFVILRTFPVGTTSLLSFETPMQTPFGIPVSLDAGSFIGILGWAFLLVLLGWIIGAAYYYWVSKVALKSEAGSIWKSMKQAIYLSLIWMGLLFFIGFPAMVLLSVLMAISAVLGQVALFAGAMILVWLVIPIFFSPHGIFTLQLDAFRAIMNSLRMVRFTLPNTGLFLLMFLVLNQGLNFLWVTPPQDSWWTLVGITGHAFVSTALLAASFIYYRDINAWLKVVFEQLQQQTTAAKA
jgi:hypothetical protein